MTARSSWRAGLPVSLTRLAGRERELAEVTRLVQADRSVTLAGAGGAGKTRLAAEVAVAGGTVAARPACRDPQQSSGRLNVWAGNADLAHCSLRPPRLPA